MTRSTDREWLEWTAIQRRIVALEAASRYEEALEEIDKFLSTRPKQDLVIDALALRGLIRKHKGELDLAKLDLQSAWSIISITSYSRYTIELSLGALCEEQGSLEEAALWYLRALETASKDLGTSGGSALGRLLEIRDYASLSDEQKALCLQAARQAWKLFGLPGEPDITDLKKTVRVLSEAATRPLKAPEDQGL